MVKFVKQLDTEQLKTLVILGLAECDRNDDFEPRYLYDYDIRVLDDLDLKINEWTNVLGVAVFDSKTKSIIACLSISDFSMYITDGGWGMNLDNIVKIYLASQFGDDYISDLYTKRIEDANEERKMLYTESPKVFDEYCPRWFLKNNKTDSSSKVKTIGTINIIE